MRHEIQTSAYVMPVGAELLGGNHDGAVVQGAQILLPADHVNDGPLLEIELDCGCHVRCAPSTLVTWLEPRDDVVIAP